VITLPSTSSGRFYLAYVVTEDTGTTPPTPSGWTFYTITGSTTYSTFHSYKTFIYYKFWDTGDPSSVTFVAGSPGYYRDVYISCYDGVDTTTPFHKFETLVTNNSTTLYMPSITTTINNTLVLNILSYDRVTDDYTWIITKNANASLGTASGFIGYNRWQGSTQYGWYASKVAAGVVSATTATAESGYLYNMLGITIALTPSLNTSLIAEPAINVVNNPPTSSFIITRVLEAGSANLNLSGQPSELTTQTNVFASALINLDNVSGNLVGDVFDYTVVNKTLSNLTSSSTAVLKISSSVSKTLSVLTSSATAASLIRGTSSNTLSDTTLNSTGQFYKSAVIDTTLESLSGIVHGVVKLSSSLSKSLSNTTLDSQSLLKTNGTFNQSLGTLTAISTAVPFLFKNATTNVTLENVSINASEYINIAPESYFSPPAGYYLYETRFINTEPKIVYYSKNYASLLDTPTTAIGSYGEVNSFKILITVLAIYKNISDSSITVEEKKKFRFEVLPDWSIMRDQTIIDYFEGKTLSTLPPAAFIDYMKSLGYYK